MLKKDVAKLFLCAIAMAFFAACGEDSSSSESVASESDMIVTKYDDLPVCSDTREGIMAYVKEKNIAYVCVDGNWTLEECSSDSTTPSTNESSSSGRNIEESSSDLDGNQGDSVVSEDTSGLDS
jgi:hypothetical protein